MKKVKFNVGLLCDSYLPVIDGVSICMKNYAEWMTRKVGGVEVVAPKFPGFDYDSLGYSVLNYLSAPIKSRPPYVFGMPFLDFPFMDKFGKRRYKIIHVHSPFISGQMGLLMAREQGIPLVATFHSKYKDDFASYAPDLAVDVAIKVLMSFYEKADLVWVPQESAIDVIREYGYKGNVDVMENGTDLAQDYPEKFFVEARQRLGVAPDEFVMLFVGQHIWQKNPRLVIEALKRINDCTFRMFFVGNGYAAEEMKHLVSEYGLDRKVTFAGTVSDRNVITDYYAAADLFLFPSLYDTAGLVVREAASLHTPSVMAREATAASIIKDENNGFLTDNDPDRMADLLRSLIHDPARVKRVGEQASRTLVRSWEDVVDEVLDRYNALLRSRSLPLIEKQQ